MKYAYKDIQVSDLLPISMTGVAATENTQQVAGEAVAHPPEGESAGGIGAIGIDGSVLFFQLLNFLILLWILTKVAYKPILKVLEERRRRIEESLKSAQEIEKRAAASREEQAELLRKAREEAETLIAQTRAEAAALMEKSQAEAEIRAKQQLVEAHSRLQQEIKEVRRQLKAETMQLVAQATEVLVGEKLDTEKDRKSLEQTIKAMRSEA